MIKYNRDKRGTYNARINKHRRTGEICDRCDRIHTRIRYDGCDKIEYIPIIYGKARDTHERTYVSVTNVMNEIFPEINAPHNTHIYRATAPYRKFIITQPAIPHTAPEHMMDEYRYTATRTGRVKCIIYSNDKIIYTGVLRRTIEIDGKDIRITLHKANRSIQVKPYIPMTDEIHGVPIREIYKHDVEIYKI